MNTPGEDRLTPDQVAGDLLARIMAGEVTTRAVLADYEQLVRENQQEITRQATRADAAERRVAELVEAITYLFTPGPGIAVPEPYPEREEYEPHKKTWNRKIAKLLALVPQAAPKIYDCECGYQTSWPICTKCGMHAPADLAPGAGGPRA